MHRPGSAQTAVPKPPTVHRHAPLLREPRCDLQVRKRLGSACGAYKASALGKI